MRKNVVIGPTLRRNSGVRMAGDLSAEAVPPCNQVPLLPVDQAPERFCDSQVEFPCRRWLRQATGEATSSWR